jgi:endonuclease/exonuclease/phosphatase family metal-dependent hydrolase
MLEFSLLSLNTFGIPFFISQPRLNRLAQKLNQLAPSVLCLQEIQQNAYLKPLQRHLAAYSQFVSIHNPIAPKGGLFTAITSTCRVMKSQFYPYPNQGHPLSIGFSDWALNKGVLLVSLEVNEHNFSILNTHLQANYLADWRPTNAQTKIQLDQVAYLAELARAQPPDAWVIVCGDFNFPRISPAYQHLIAQSGLVDALADDPRPSYQPFPLVSGKWHTSLDYMLYRQPEGDRSSVTADILPMVNTFARWWLQRFLTDHYALTINIL